MKYRTTVVREGELLGPVDWDYDFLQHFQGYGCGCGQRKEICDRRVAILRQIVDEPQSWEVNVSGYWHPLYAVGMYDGWPFWKPTPAVLAGGVLGSEWHFYYDLQDCRKLPGMGGTP